MFVCTYLHICCILSSYYLLIPQSSDWLAGFHLELWQATVPIAVFLSAAVFMATSFNPSAWGHLNPSSYCDVGRLFYGVFKLWSKLQRKK